MLKILIASLITGAVSYIATKLLPLRSTDNSFLSTFPKFVVICLVSGVTYIIVCWIMKIEEVKPVVDKITGVLFKNIK